MPANAKPGLLAAFLLLLQAHGAAPESSPDTWLATDALGRALPDHATAGPRRQDRTALIFYYLWHGSHGSRLKSIPDVLAADPKAINNWDSPAWGPPGAFHLWGEPLLGHYRMPDEWVIRRHIRMLTDAGVDSLFFDVTNAFTYDKQAAAVATALQQSRAAGRPAPALGFLAYAKSGQTVDHVYNNFYTKGLFKDLWFPWEGKPLVLANTAELSETAKGFFTARHSWAWQPGENKWPWLEESPQKGGWTGDPKNIEFASVSTASHPSSNHGKSYALKKQLPPDQADSRLGLKFAEQWRSARRLDPKVLMVTQWNEWMAQRFRYEGGGQTHAGYRIAKGDPWFIDVFNAEYNRDIEPMKGGWGDCYYAQMIDGLRRFKGVGSGTLSIATKTIDINNFETWEGVGPIIADDRGDTDHHDAEDLAGKGRLVNKTGRNDITAHRAAQDRDNLYFLAETAAPLTPRETGGWNWMNLWIRLENADLPSWESFHFTVNQRSGSDKPPRLWRCQGGWKWTDAGEVKLNTAGGRVALAIPRAALGLAPGAAVELSYKWTDNCGETADSWLTDGDAAPNWRFRQRLWSAGSGATPGRGRTYRLTSQADGRALTATPDGRAIPSENRFLNEQKWTFCDVGGGTFALVSVPSAFGETAGVLTRGPDSLSVAPWTGAPNQRWATRTREGWTALATNSPLPGLWACEEVSPLSPGQLVRLESAKHSLDLGTPTSGLTASPAILGRAGPSFAWQANPDGTRILFVNELTRLNLADTRRVTEKAGSGISHSGGTQEPLPPVSTFRPLEMPFAHPDFQWRLFGTTPGSYAVVTSSPAATPAALAVPEANSAPALLAVDPADTAQHWRLRTP